MSELAESRRNRLDVEDILARLDIRKQELEGAIDSCKTEFECYAVQFVQERIALNEKIVECDNSIKEKWQMFEEEMAASKNQIAEESLEKKQELKIDRDKLDAERARWEQEKERMNKAFAISEGKVKLNVGGTKYETSVSTLTSVPDTFFSAMFSGRFENKKDEEGYIFIDRDGLLFRNILNFLREPTHPEMFQSLESNERRWLKVEANFYGLNDLNDAIYDERPSPAPTHQGHRVR
jgi:hypothetical protein